MTTSPLPSSNGSFPAADWPDLAARVAPVARADVLELVVGLLDRVPGHIVEFGVAEGHSTRVIRRALTRHELLHPGRYRRRVYACDSFEGLPEKYERAEVGAFACEPPDIRGVQIVKGYYDDSLTPALAAEVGTVAFASLDADLYSSTMTALRWLTPLLGNGSLLLFDEYLGEQESEKRAHDDWAAETGTTTVKVAEFLREPSAWGDVADRRVLLQVVGDPAARGTVGTGAVPGTMRPVEVEARRMARRLKRLVR
jgi:hypothetical protein